MHLSRDQMDELLFGPIFGRRLTQDSPILPDVWLAYALEAPTANEKNHHKELLLTPHYGSTPGDVAVRLRESLGTEAPSAKIAYNQTYVAAKLSFEQIVRHVLPMTAWWYDRVLSSLSQLEATTRSLDSNPDGRVDLGLGLKVIEGLLVNDLNQYAAQEKSLDQARPRRPTETPEDLLWMIRLVGYIWHVLGGNDNSEPTAKELVDAAIELYSGMAVTIPIKRSNEEIATPGPVRDPNRPRLVYLVNLNRTALLAVTRSAIAVKADAARRLFAIDCSQISWAVIDSGIDAKHPAFLRTRDFKPAKPISEDPRPEDPRRMGGYKGDQFPKWMNHTRVKKTYDFTKIRDLLDPSNLGEDRELVKKVLARIQGEAERKTVLADLQDLRNRLNRGRSVDWKLLERFLEIPHDDEHYIPPYSDHGTHVAGILAGDWPQRLENGVPFQGVCPDIELYDLRVVNPLTSTEDDEFAVLAALQFVAYLNDQHDYYAIHGVNLSLSIRHQIANFACGRTPICDECDRLVSTGVVVVAAAGNDGYLRFSTADKGEQPGYHTVSITDPGNAETVITVGSTHRFLPHTYGVSYFSSRGPTGDGRIKPDLVAPGEKIRSTLMGIADTYSLKEMDGTSMAAPHVSGAAALLMARYSEFVGEPLRIKKVLCSSATDLGRERYFQGNGMLDILRALQSV